MRWGASMICVIQKKGLIRARFFFPLSYCPFRCLYRSSVLETDASSPRSPQCGQRPTCEKYGVKTFHLFLALFHSVFLIESKDPFLILEFSAFVIRGPLQAKRFFVWWGASSKDGGLPPYCKVNTVSIRELHNLTCSKLVHHYTFLSFILVASSLILPYFRSCSHFPERSRFLAPI